MLQRYRKNGKWEDGEWRTEVGKLKLEDGDWSRIWKPCYDAGSEEQRTLAQNQNLPDHDIDIKPDIFKKYRANLKSELNKRRH